MASKEDQLTAAESASLFQKIVDAFVEGGYYPARIASLPPFDRLIGGLAFAISSSNVDINLEMDYDEGATLGYKIKLGERIEATLVQMECPYPLQAHQIQGLDYPAVLPVVQWLVKKLVELRREFGDKVAALERRIASGQRQLALATARRDAARLAQEEAQARAVTEEERLRSLEGVRGQFLRGSGGSAAWQAGLERLTPQLRQLQEGKEKESAFKSKCKGRRKALLVEIAELEEALAEGAEGGPEAEAEAMARREAEVEGQVEEERQRVGAAQQALADVERQLALLQRKHDSMATQGELVQYERRFVELHEQIQWRLRETKRYYATYNSLTDINKLLVKETSLVDSIHTQFDAAMTSPGGRSQLLQSMEAISSGVQQMLERAEQKLQGELRNLAAANDRYSAFIGEQRRYYALVKELQDECTIGEELRRRLSSSNEGAVVERNGV